MPEDTPVPYEVGYFQVKEKDFTENVQNFFLKAMDEGKRPYVQICSNDSTPIAASTVDEWLDIEISRIGKDNVFLISGKPPSGCPPGGCH